MNSRNIAKSIAKYASDKKAEDILILDMRKLVNFTDYFVICSGNSDRQVKAIAEHIEDEAADKLGVHMKLKNGMRNSNWIVFDSSDVITHVFHKDARTFYNLEGLWQNAKEVSI